MKRIFIFLLLTISIVSNATNYYVKNAGSDAANGLTNGTAWQTISKVNGSSFSAGDTIFFNKGDIWRETLTIPSSGTIGVPIVFTSYGTGVAPIIQPTTQVTSWTQVGATNVWYGTLTTAPAQVFISDVYCQPAHWPATAGSSTPIFQYPSGNSADATHLTDVDLTGIAEASLVGVQVNIYNSGDKQRQAAISAFNDGTDIITIATVTNNPLTTDQYYLTAPSGAGLTYANRSWMITENTWFYDTDAQRLYVWKTGGGNPGTVEASTGNNAIYASDKSYITIDGLHARYTNAEGIFITNWNLNINGITVQNCTSDYNTYDGIRIGKTSYAQPADITNIYVINNTIDHNNERGVLTGHADSVTITDNVITYTGGIYPQLPGGGHASLSAAIYILVDENVFLVDGNNISNTTQDGIYYSTAPNGTISNNIITNTSLRLPDSGGIYSTEAGNNVIYSYNTFTNAGNAIYFDEISDGGMVEHNIINGGAIGLLLHRAYNVTVRYNYFTGPFTAGYGAITINNTTVTSTGLVFAYKIIDGVNNTNDGIRIGGNASLVNALMDIQNNLIMNCSIGIEEYEDRASEIDDLNNNIFYNNTTHIQALTNTAVSIDNNLYYGTGNWDWDHVSKATFALWKTASSVDANSLNVDPLFVSSSDFHLTASSPAKDAGIDVGLTHDYDGNNIPFNTLFDIGAYEYGSGAVRLLIINGKVQRKVTGEIIMIRQ